MPSFVRDTPLIVRWLGGGLYQLCFYDWRAVLVRRHSKVTEDAILIAYTCHYNENSYVSIEFLALE